MESFSSRIRIFLILTVLGNLYSVSGRCTGYRSPMTMKSAMGEIMSPLYPSSYMDKENCQWNLTPPFGHSDYMVVFSLMDVHLSYVKSGQEKEKKCTGHLSYFREETDCRAEKISCSAYYKSSNCEKIATETYTTCTLHKRSSIYPVEVKFTSDKYFPQFTPQRGFRLRYEFVDCTPVTTPPPTTTEMTTPEATTQLITTQPITTQQVTTTVRTTTEETTTPIPTTEPTTTKELEATTTARPLPEFNQTAKFVLPGTSEKQTQLPNWIYAPIAAAAVVVVVIIILIVVLSRRKKKQDDINWLMGFENPHFTDLRYKSRDEDAENPEEPGEYSGNARPNIYTEASSRV